MIQKTNLFSAGEGGYHNCRIPTILCTPGGVVLASVEARPGSGSDYDDNSILLRRSTDAGLTWDAPRLIVANADYGPGPCSNFVMTYDREINAIHALFCHDYNRCFYMRSTDDGATFSAPVEITATFDEFHSSYPWQVIATGPGHGTQMTNGRIVVPVWMSDGSGGEFGSGKRGHRPSAASVIFSDDNGETWERGDVVCLTGDVCKHPSETVAVELTDGSLLLNIRTESDVHRRLISISPNGATEWEEEFYDDALLEPVCMASLIRYSGGPGSDEPSRILFANPDNLEQEFTNWEPARDRKRLTVKLSLDDCKTWLYSRIIEEGPSGYSDLAVTPDGTILCFYESGMASHMCDSRNVELALFSLAWVMGEKV